MNFSPSFYRKIVYAVLAAVLLLPISYLARPRSVGEDRQVQEGGTISKLREKHSLSQASLSEVDPTSEIMKLGSLGLHGVAVNVLWNRANEYQEKKAFDKVRSTLDTLILLQPNFVSVWEFQGHNLAYNISREFDDYEDRYFWVKEGLNFFMNGIAFNKRDHRIFDNLGLHTGLKLGKSDEKRQFREIFRHDQEYIVNQLSRYGITEDEISNQVTGPDNWLWAYQWYDKSYNMVENQGVQQRTSDLMYWMKRESQLRNFADAMDDEFPPGPESGYAWERAAEAWMIYGNRPITTSFGQEITFEGLQPEEEEFEKIEAKIDEMAPGARERIRQEKIALLQDDFKEAFETPADQRTFKQQMLMRPVNEMISVSNAEVVGEVPPDQRPAAVELEFDGRRMESRLWQIRNYRQTVNYEFWRNRNRMESTDAAVEARSNFYRATELIREAKYQDYEEEQTIDGQTQFVKQEGAITLLRKSFAAWSRALVDYPYLTDEESAFLDELFEDMRRFYQLLRDTGEAWPNDFELQELVDTRERKHGDSGLPTTSQLEAKSLDIGGMIPIQEEDDKSEPEAAANEASDSPETSAAGPEAGKDGDGDEGP